MVLEQFLTHILGQITTAEYGEERMLIFILSFFFSTQEKASLRLALMKCKNIF
jgi:hypothetical protein